MLVIDASATLYLLASESGLAPFADQTLVAPALLWSEATSVLSEMRWRREISSSLADAMFDRLLGSPIDRHVSGELYRDTRELARQLGWAKTYDAEYVALAKKLGVDLMSRDARLRRGAGRLINVLSPDEVVPPDIRQGSNNPALPVNRAEHPAT